MTLDPIRPAIVALRASVPDSAFTAGSLGTRREGSGVVIGDGLVLTVGYLVTEATEVWLTTHDGRAVPGYVQAYDQQTGFGLVHALGELDLPPLALGRSGEAPIGVPVTFIDGTGQSVRAAIVARQEFAGYWEYLLDDAIFIAPAHPSWGGAALVGDDGRLLGIGSLRLQMIHGEEVADINMVVPIDLLAPILDDMTTRGAVLRPPRPWLGVFSAETNGEVVVMSVAEGGPAARAGLQRGDVISDVGDAAVDSLADFYRRVWNQGPAGAEVPMRIVRDGRDAWLRIKSADRDSFLRKPLLQ